MEQNNLDSLYAAYKLEFENVHTVIEPQVGFANYKLEDKNSIYVQEVYVVPEFRGNRWAAKLTTKCIEDAERKYNIKLNKIYTTIGVGGKTVDSSLQAITEYGFKLLSSSPNLIVFSKELINV